MEAESSKLLVRQKKLQDSEAELKAEHTKLEHQWEQLEEERRRGQAELLEEKAKIKEKVDR